MRKGANLKALKGAINKFGAPQIHHSDRGSQYGSQAYIDLLAKHQVQISMAKSGPQNAYAERINLTIKDEFLNHWQIPDLIMLKRLTRKAVNYYNYKRKHNHLGRLTPIAFLKAYPALAVNDRPIVNIPILNS
jgi:putative transposase